MRENEEEKCSIVGGLDMTQKNIPYLNLNRKVTLLSLNFLKG